MATATALDVTALRADFPSLARMTMSGTAVIYADAPSETQVPQSVVDAMGDYLVWHNSHIQGECAATRETDDKIGATRIDAGHLVDGDPDTVAFGQDITTLNFSVWRAIGRTRCPGDHIVVTCLDHDADVSSWLILAEDQGLQVCIVKVTPACAIADLAPHGGATAVVDAVACAPHRRIDVEALDCDVLLCSPYTCLGPHLGIAWVRPTLIPSPRPDRVRPAGMEPPRHRFETGSLTHEALAGPRAAVLRLGFAHYATCDGIDRCICALANIARVPS